jgi:hypothetical protein
LEGEEILITYQKMRERKEFKEEDGIENRGKEEMPIHRNGRTYYRTYAEALHARRRGDRIYYDAEVRAYYIVRPQSGSWWF